MKIPYKTIFILCCSLLIQQPSFAGSTQLPLSDKEIKKLQQLFPAGNSVPEFQQITHEHVIWQQAPINVTLPVGKERMIHFPTSVEFGYDKSILPDDKLKVQNNAGTLYLILNLLFQCKEFKYVVATQVRLSCLIY